MTTFLLLHGAWHGGWAWDRVAPELTAAGHAVVAPDLPCDDVDAGAVAYCDAALAALPADPGDVVVGAHSAGGLTAPLVAEAAGARAIVLVSALLPAPGRRFVEQNAEEHVLLTDYQAGVQRDEQGRRAWVDEGIARQHMYNGCSDADAAWAFAHLRPQSSTLYSEVSPVAAWPEIATTDVRAPLDRLVSPDWARKAVPERLGVRSIVIDGAGHSSLISHPERIAEILLAA